MIAVVTQTLRLAAWSAAGCGGCERKFRRQRCGDGHDCGEVILTGGWPFVQVVRLERPQSLGLDEDYQPMVGCFVSSIFARISELAADLVSPIFA